MEVGEILENYGMETSSYLKTQRLKIVDEVRQKERDVKMNKDGNGDGGDERERWVGAVGRDWGVGDDASGSRRARGSRLYARFRAALRGGGRVRQDTEEEEGRNARRRAKVRDGVCPWMESSLISHQSWRPITIFLTAF